jgi:hypothetical protein
MAANSYVFIVMVSLYFHNVYYNVYNVLLYLFFKSGVDENLQFG